ncbi:MAG: hypothetical protein H5T83_02780, partial [Actinotalea sp.]|nr:hypothetical protein [Actinotalea sp.]
MTPDRAPDRADDHTFDDAETGGVPADEEQGTPGSLPEAMFTGSPAKVI